MGDGVDRLEASRILDRFREQRLSGDPDWGPLEEALPSAWWAGFMWMTRITQGEVVIELYKHGITRRYLNLDQQGGAWRYDSGKGVYRPQPVADAVDWVFESLETLGADRASVYDADFIAARNRRLRELGWTVVL